MAKAKIEDATEGFIKIIFEPKYREILGVHIIGAKATELIAEFTLGKALKRLSMRLHTPYIRIQQYLRQSWRLPILRLELQYICSVIPVLASGFFISNRTFFNLFFLKLKEECCGDRN